MKACANLKCMGRERNAVVLAVGFFDGVHKGHRRVIQAAVNRARKLGGRAWVMTFDPHPMDVLKHGAAPLLLTSTQHKLQLLSGLGIHGCFVMPFTRRLAAVEPEGFVRSLRCAIPALREIVVGENWRFGRREKGDATLLARLGGEMGFTATVVKSAVHKGKAISSTRIRGEIMRGNLDGAGAMLGRPFSVLGTVVHGKAVGGKLGFPTANMDCHSEALPPCGIYAARALVNGRMRAGVINLGVRPTFEKRNVKPMLELHLFNFHKNLYGRDLEVFFVKKLRNERRFASAEGLAAQIAKDVAAARRVLAK
jgi:riboflavin kinase / FMN adenylyltransferase